MKDVRQHWESASDYCHAQPNRSMNYLFAPLLAALRADRSIKRVLELGCGTGDVAASLIEEGYDVVATDPSQDALRRARVKHPNLPLEDASVYDDRLVERFGTWDAVVALEVVEHLYRPKLLGAAAYSLLAPDGLFVLSTPYHGYWKNLALALAGRYDDHFMPLRDHGHIKFWSKATISQLLESNGFRSIAITGVGRFRPFFKSMIVVSRKPA